MNDRPKIPALPVGGSPLAIVPQTLEETYRLAAMIVEAGFAPQALAGKEPRQNDSNEIWDRYHRKAKAAVGIVLMSGAELGQTPMVALRSWTSINGKPALYGEGLINVARSSPKCKSLQTGFIADAPPDFFLEKGMDKHKVATLKTMEERSVGWVWAKRADTGEEKFEIFSIANAKKAGLWDERSTVRRKKWNSEEWEDKSNEAPWHRYPERMLRWRAAGFGLRELFADILAGVRDEFEMREIDGEFERLDEPTAKISPPSPPSATDAPASSGPPSPPSPSAEIEIDPREIVEETGESTDAVMDGEPFDFGEFFENLQIGFAWSKTEADVEQIWADMDVEATFADDAESLELAQKVKARRLAALHPLNGG